MLGQGITLRKALVCPYFGDLPEWMDRYWENAERLESQGYNFLLDTSESEFRDRVRDRLGIEPPRMYNTGNVWDFRPALGLLYADELKDYDFWGHTDFDCVYGRVEEFYLDTALARYDILSDHWSYVCGPWTLYRNDPVVSEMFRESEGWQEAMESQVPLGWAEQGYSETVKKNLRVRLRLTHAWQQPEKLSWEDDALIHDGGEVSFFHFRHTKTWPL